MVDIKKAGQRYRNGYILDYNVVEVWRDAKSGNGGRPAAYLSSVLTEDFAILDALASKRRK